MTMDAELRAFHFPILFGIFVFFMYCGRYARTDHASKTSRGRKPRRHLSDRQRRRISKEVRDNLKKSQIIEKSDLSDDENERSSKLDDNNELPNRVLGATELPSHLDIREQFVLSSNSDTFMDSTCYSVGLAHRLDDKQDDSYSEDEGNRGSSDESCNDYSSTDSEASQTTCTVVNDSSRGVVSFQDKLASCFVDNNLNNNAIDNILRVLRLHKCLAYLPKCARTLLSTPRQPIQLFTVAPGLYLHLGVQAAIIAILLVVNPSSIPNQLQVDFSTDGATLDNSGNNQIWPIQLRIANIARSKTEVVGIYRGKGKPNNAMEFFEQFVEETNRIFSDGGITFNGRKLTITLRCFVADALARAFMLNHMGHVSYHACSKCKVSGDFVDRCMIFQGLDHAPRTDDEYIRKVDEDHHKEGVSPLSLLPLGMVSRVPFEYMHLVCLGIVKRLLSAWVHGKFTFRTKLSARQIEVISARLEGLQKYYPQEFARPPRKLQYFHHYKATEYRQFLLYTGPVVTYRVLRPDVYTHFLLLHAAMRVLVTTSPSQEHLTFASLALRIFVERSATLYGPTFLSYNTHGLLHVVDDVRLLGPLDTYSAFPYENNMSIFRRYCRKPDLPLQQIANRRAERAQMSALIKPKTTVPAVALDWHAKGPLPNNIQPNVRQYRRLKGQNFILTRSNRDKCCILKNGSICVIENILLIESLHYLVVKKFEIAESFYDVGIPSSSVNFFKCSTLRNELSLVNFNEVHIKAYLMPYWDSRWVDQNETEQPVFDSFLVASMSSSVHH